MSINYYLAKNCLDEKFTGFLNQKHSVVEDQLSDLHQWAENGYKVVFLDVTVCDNGIISDIQYGISLSSNSNRSVIPTWIVDGEEQGNEIMLVVFNNDQFYPMYFKSEDLLKSSVPYNDIISAASKIDDDEFVYNAFGLNHDYIVMEAYNLTKPLTFAEQFNYFTEKFYLSEFKPN